MKKVPSRKEVECAFQSMDKSGDNKVHVHELQKYLEDHNVCDPEFIAAMFRDIDTDGDKHISMQEFVDEMMKDPRGQAIEQAFQGMDTDGSGFINQDECMRGGEKAGLTDIEILQKCYKEMDKNCDERVSIAEFCEYMNQFY